MKRSRFTEGQIIGILREQEAGMATAEVCRKHGISGATFYIYGLFSPCKLDSGGLTWVDCKHLYGVIEDPKRPNGASAHIRLNKWEASKGRYKRQVPHVLVRPVCPFRVPSCNFSEGSQVAARYTSP